MSTHEQLSAASNDRKSRLAQLKSLKRKQSPVDDAPADTAPPSDSNALSAPEAASVTSTYLSGRNFDPSTRTLKLGYTAPPIGDAASTLEYKAAQLALETKQHQDQESRDADKGLDLFKLQPKRPNWDLKRDLKEKMKVLDSATDKAIATAVRERVEAQKRDGGKEKKKITEREGEGEGEEVGMEGSELVEAMHLKEQEDERERKREAEDENENEDAS